MIEIKNLSLSLDSKQILTNISFSLENKEVILLLGENGAGKSMLLKSIGGWYNNYEGTVKIDGINVKNIKQRERAKKTAFISQDMETHFPYSVYEVVEMGRFVLRGAFSPFVDEDYEAIEKAIKLMDIHRFVHKNVNEISTGERTRVFIARALVTEADTFLLDEPTAALDVRRTLEIFSLINELQKQGKSVIMSIHSINDALKLGYKTLILHEGKTAGYGKAKDILTEETIERVYGVRCERDTSFGFSL